MRRYKIPQQLAANWAVQHINLDLFALPNRFVALVSGRLAGLLRIRDHVVINSRHVAVQREIFGFKLAPRRLSIKDFDGVALRIAPRAADPDGFEAGFIYSVNLHHKQADLCLPLFMDRHDLDVGAHWQAWGRMLNLPLLVPALDGSFRSTETLLGSLPIKQPVARASRLILHDRRPLTPLQRQIGRKLGKESLSGYEIIARH